MKYYICGNDHKTNGHAEKDKIMEEVIHKVSFVLKDDPHV